MNLSKELCIDLADTSTVLYIHYTVQYSMNCVGKSQFTLFQGTYQHMHNFEVPVVELLLCNYCSICESLSTVLINVDDCKY